jgi:hypothetical protein
MGAKIALTKPPWRVMRTVFLSLVSVALNIVIFRHGITVHGTHPLLILASCLFWWSLYANWKRR